MEKQTKLLVSSAAVGLSLKKTYNVTEDLGVDGIELMPFRGTTINRVKKYSEKHNKPVFGLHFPFWWEPKNLRQVCEGESSIREKLFNMFINKPLIGAGHENCRSIKMAKEFKDAYLLFHTDTYKQMPQELLTELISGRDIFFENERAKLNEGDWLYNPYLIKDEIIPELTEKGINANLMFDSRHYQISHLEGKMKDRPKDLGQVWAELMPHGMHFSYISDEGSFKTRLPAPEVWDSMKDPIKTYPPQIVVLEIGPGNLEELYKAREMVNDLLDI
jgi:hypothetical protein